MVLARTTFLDVFWWMLVMYFWVMAIWLFISLVGDVMGRDDLSGLSKAGWVTFMVLLPFLGALIYIAARRSAQARMVGQTQTQR